MSAKHDPKSLQHRMESLQDELSKYLDLIQQYVRSRNLDLPMVTLLLRDPANPGSILVLSSEPTDQAITAAFEQAKSTFKPPGMKKPSKGPKS